MAIILTKYHTGYYTERAKKAFKLLVDCWNFFKGEVFIFTSIEEDYMFSTLNIGARDNSGEIVLDFSNIFLEKSEKEFAKNFFKLLCRNCLKHSDQIVKAVTAFRRSFLWSNNDPLEVSADLQAVCEYELRKKKSCRWLEIKGRPIEDQFLLSAMDVLRIEFEKKPFDAEILRKINEIWKNTEIS